MGLNSNAVARSAEASSPSKVDAQAFISQQIGFDELLIALAREQLTPDKNSGKQRFYAVVTKVLDKPEQLTDLFLSPWYEAQRLDGVTDINLDSEKVVFLHVPALYTYFTRHDAENRKKKHKELTSTDLLKIPTITELNVKIGDIVEVTFDNVADHSGARILTAVNKKRRRRLRRNEKKYISSKEIMKNIAACKLLSLEKAEGYAITTRTLLNSRNPTYGYAGLYQRLTSAQTGLLDSTGLIRRIVISNTTAELKNKGYVSSDVDNSSQALVQLAEKADSFTFEFKIYGSNKIRDFLSETQWVKNNPNNKPAVEALPSNLAAIKNSDRSLFLNMVLTTPSVQAAVKKSLEEDIADYLGSIIKKDYNYGWSSAGNSIYQIDIFGNSIIDKDLQSADVDKAIEYSNKKINASSASPESREIVSRSPELTKKDPAVAAKEAADQEPKKTATVKSDLPNCEDQSEINNEVYINLATAKKVDLASFQRDNKRFKKIVKFLSSEGNLPPPAFRTPALVGYDAMAAMKAVLPVTKSFSYKLTTEVIAAQPEGQAPKQPAKAKGKPKNKKPKRLQRGTNSAKMAKNAKRLAEFVGLLQQIIASNEGLEQRRVLVFPIRVFRKFKYNKRGSGQDQNSRHFFNRAIDFVVYINTSEGFKGFEKDIPREGTYRIPNTIAYLYVLKLIQMQRAPFGICGLGLLRRGIMRKDGYIHYEYMGELDKKGKDYVKINRRWVSKPKSRDKSSVYAQAFDRPDTNKDSIIKAFVGKEIKAKLGILPDKFENLL